MFGFHGWDLLVILLIVLLLFGARRLPELGSSLGQSFKMLQKGMSGDSDQPKIEGAKVDQADKQPETVESDR
jgi:sec-independent protein translocase protein TatA